VCKRVCKKKGKKIAVTVASVADTPTAATTTTTAS